MSNRHMGAIVKIANIRKHENADRLACTSIFGSNVVVGINTQVGEVGIFFGDDIQLSEAFCRNNNLYSDKTLNVNPEAVGYFSPNRRVKSQRFRGEKSEGIFLPLSCLDYLSCNIDFKVGDFIDQVCGEEICRKYISPKTVKSIQGQGKQKAAKKSLVPFFKEHMDTEQLDYYLDHIKDGDCLIVTEKLHGTSGRCSNTLAVRKKGRFERLLNWFGINTPEYEYKFAVGSRTVVKSVGEEEVAGPGFYWFDIWKESSERFRHLLSPGETVYYEIVGYLPDGQLIMNSQSSDKLKKLLNPDEYDDFLNRYGNTTTFSYACAPKEYDIYIYRISMTSGDGSREYDLSWDQVKERCFELGEKHVPELSRWDNFDVDSINELVEEVKFLAAEPSELFPTHLREGVCVRIDNRIRPKMLKSKSFIFKCLEGIIKESDVVDIEESQNEQ